MTPQDNEEIAKVEGSVSAHLKDGRVAAVGSCKGGEYLYLKITNPNDSSRPTDAQMLLTKNSFLALYLSMSCCIDRLGVSIGDFVNENLSGTGSEGTLCMEKDFVCQDVRIHTKLEETVNQPQGETPTQ